MIEQTILGPIEKFLVTDSILAQGSGDFGMASWGGVGVGDQHCD